MSRRGRSSGARTCRPRRPAASWVGAPRPRCRPSCRWTPWRWPCGPGPGAGQQVSGLIHHSDAGSQYTSIRYTDRLLDAGALASIGTVGDSYDNAEAESLIGLYQTECTKREGPWRGVDDLELATLSWVDWFNHSRLHSSLGDIPPVEYEAAHDATTALPALVGEPVA